MTQNYKFVERLNDLATELTSAEKETEGRPDLVVRVDNPLYFRVAVKEAASLIQGLGEALLEARDMLRSCRVVDDAEAHEAWTIGLATIDAAISKLKEAR